MCLYDMMKNPGVSFEDISDRQSALGASSLRVKHRDPAKPDGNADNKESASPPSFASPTGRILYGTEQLSS